MQDLKALSQEEMKVLAQEIREEIIKVVSVNGGHLSSNLGVVELTLALHFVFNAPRDKIVWDVGHQTYAHKLITGRKDRFGSLRQYKGLAGFPKREESPYDTYDSGHSSTSISLGLGLASARDLKKENYAVVCVVGDGALTSGVAFEGLNQAGGLKKDLIVVLNDNEMSISKNVGALSHYLTRLITLPEYNRARQELQKVIAEVPLFGPRMLNLGKRLEEALKGMLVPATLFEELGFRYFGPLDGHNLKQLIDVLQKVKNFKGPILVHVLTKKGKGYKFSEENPTPFHSARPFNIQTGKFLNAGATAPLSYTEVFSQALIQMAEKNERLVAITAAMPTGTGLKEFARQYPSRFFDVGIAESHALIFAAGLALEGYRPIVAIYSTFLQRGYDQILHDICLQGLPVIMVLDRAGIVGEDGPTHQGIFDLSYLGHFPALVLIAPRDEEELKEMLDFALKNDRPIAIRYPRSSAVQREKGRRSGKQKVLPLKMGKAEVLKEGKDIAILALGSMVCPGLASAESLAKKGIEAGVINMRFARPLDKELIIKLVSSVPRLVTIEENVLSGGFGAGVLELLEREGLLNKVKILRLGLPDEFIEHGPRSTLLAKYGLDKKGISQSIAKWLREKYLE